MEESYQKKVQEIKKKFSIFNSSEERYSALIEMGRKLPPLLNSDKTAERIVKGCQSLLFLKATSKNGLLFFEASSDALISAGLAALLIAVYSGETAETILKCPPDFLQELGIPASLSLNRSNGLRYIHLKMKQEALKSLLASPALALK